MIQEVFTLDTGFCTHPECSVMRGGSLASKRFPSTVLVLIHQTAGVLLLDAGYAPRFHTATRRGLPRLYAAVTPVSTSPGQAAVEQLKNLGIAAADVRHLVLSHFHGDHIAGLRDFPQAKLHFRREGYTALKDLSPVRKLLAGFLPSLLPDDFRTRAAAWTSSQLQRGLLPFKEFADGYDLLGDGSVVGIDLPGHAAGHMGLLVRRPSEDLFFIADAAWLSRSVRERRMPSAVTRLIIDDFTAYGNTLGRLHRFHQAHPEVAIVPCHCTEANQRFLRRP